MLFVMLKVFGPVVTSIFVVNYTTDITESVIEKSDFIDVADGSIKRWSVDKNIPRAWAHGLKTFACSAKLFNSPERNAYRIVPNNRSGTNNLRSTGKKYETIDVIVAILVNGFIQPNTSVAHSSFGSYPYVAVPMLIKRIAFK
tara:strand:- start:985 stop:1413 length:429 start_codon:yes stop_codon:yes gene_type:complete